MPIYIFQCSKCQTTFESFETINNMDKPLNDPCPSCLENGNMLRLVGSPNLGDSCKLEMTKGLPKPTKDFNERLRHVKNSHAGSTIEVRD
ncbi:MAG: zinc ribbon domain-containing protein [Candidatus Pacebacteria bacterium]|jgi:putative FmdB family regulatory protein|nr:zinc ribbon domain-containing protein [Candidatus Paceibacterota bacterium]|tara:strand:- start:410 stop:679 length:270 start_codon:yes stop_codon:yes gene_type:complete